MSVLIKGMEMPKGCYDCWFRHHLECGLNGYEVTTFIPITCPLVEIPSPEEQYEIITWLLNVYGKQYNNTRAAVIDWLRGENYERTD